jgi:hypothetical protein
MIIASTKQISPIGTFAQSFASQKARGRTIRSKRSNAGCMCATKAR